MRSLMRGSLMCCSFERWSVDGGSADEKSEKAPWHARKKPSSRPDGRDRPVGYLVTSTGHGIDVLTPKGIPILRIQTNYTTASIDFGGPDYDQLFIVGHGGVSRVKWGLKGQAFK